MGSIWAWRAASIDKRPVALRVLRSKTAELVRQEFYGWVLAHYAVRWLLHQGATRHRVPHVELSFTGHVQLLRRAQPRCGAFPPRASQAPTTMVR